MIIDISQIQIYYQLILQMKQINQIKPSMEELPHEKMNRYINEYKIDKDISKIIIAEKENTVLFEQMINESDVAPKNIASCLVGDIFALSKKKILRY